MASCIIIAGVDEVGRGPLAGPVISAAVILDPKKEIKGLKDSKLLSKKQRDYLFSIIQESCLAWSLGRAEIEEIDNINILQASLLSMQRAIMSLAIKPDHVLVDGLCLPKTPYKAEGIINGDKIVPSISAASIIAKVIRDKEMDEYDKIYPDYGFASHKGYGTKQHLESLQKYGITPIHRKSFMPIKGML